MERGSLEEAISLGRLNNFISGVYEVAYSYPPPRGEEYQVVWKNIKSLGKDIQSLGKNMKHLGKNMKHLGENIKSLGRI